MDTVTKDLCEKIAADVTQVLHRNVSLCEPNHQALTVALCGAATAASLVIEMKGITFGEPKEQIRQEIDRVLELLGNVVAGPPT